MRFLTKINRNYSYLLSIILVVMSVLGYFVLQAIIANETKESLLEKGILIEKQIATTGEMPNIYPIIEVKNISQITKVDPSITELYIQNLDEDEMELYLEYSKEIRIKNTNYLIKIRQASFESEDLIFIIGFSFFVLLLSSFGISFVVTKKMNKAIWKDFEHNLKEIEHFNFQNTNRINFVDSNIEEFDRLNKVVVAMAEKLKNDYLALKEFSENASHEIQTPLAIVLLNLEELLQYDLPEEVLKKVVITINAVTRLSALNKNLLLYAKIDNQQFSADRKLVLNTLVKQKLSDFEPLFEVKKLQVQFTSQQDFEVLMNDQLADILLGNLLSNAVNHNVFGGKIDIVMNSNEFMIGNTGEPNELTNDSIFNRFVKGNSKSFGLGLAIVKNICETHHLDILYSQGEMHVFSILKKKTVFKST